MESGGGNIGTAIRDHVSLNPNPIGTTGKEYISLNPKPFKDHYLEDHGT